MSFERAAELFEAVSRLEPRERERALEQSGEPEEILRLARAMLAGEAEAVGALDRPLAAGALLDDALPERVGAYEVLGVLGEGGMGLVLEARQASPRRPVALKILRPGAVSAELLSRFRDEAEALGRLDHPGIARVFEAGTATVRGCEMPYIAMELVDGEHIDARLRRTAPPLAERLELIARLAETVHHAHRKGVVHRDLKPANVLVTGDGALKVLDFGIARLADGDRAAATRNTRTGELLGTLPYMSPEQVAGEPGRVDARTDVYALGVLAYELLSGRRPLDVSGTGLEEAARRIAEDEPAPLSTLDPRLGGDVEVVIGKALAKEPGRRYATADELARDLRRVLADEPILARAPSRTYRAAKFARRHRALVLGLTAAAAVLMTSTVLATAQYLRTSELSRRLADEADTANRAIAFLEEVLDQADPYTDDELGVRDVARAAAGRLQGQFRDRPAVRARLLLMLGDTLQSLGAGAEALPLLEEAVALREQAYGPGSVEVAEALGALGQVRHDGNDLEGALRDQRRAVAVLRGAEPGRLLAETLSELATTRMDRGELAEARAIQEEALALAVELLGEDDPETLSMRHNIAVRRLFEGDLEGSERALRAVLADLPEDADTRPSTMEFLALSLRAQRRLAEAEALLREALPRAEREYGREGVLTRDILRLLGNVLSDRGRVEEAVAIQREVRAIVHRRVGPESAEGVSATHDLAFAVHDLPDKREAEGLYLEAIEGFRSLGPDHLPGVFQAQHNLSMLYWALGDLERAEELERAALEGRIALHGEGAQQTLASWRGLGDVLARRGALDEAVAVRRTTVRLSDDTYGPGSAFTQGARFLLADALFAAERHEEAEAVLLRCEAALGEMPDAMDYPRRVAGRLAALYEARGRDGEAARWRALEAER